MLLDLAVGLVNHLLATEEWARDSLKPFARQTARLELGALALPIEITADGLLAVSGNRQPAAVTIQLPADAPLRALTDRPSLFTAAHVSGSAELAERLGFVFRNLRWDAESDLSRLVGDMAAHRLVAGGKQIAQWHRRQATNLALNVAEYLTEESPSIARRQDVSSFCADVGRLQETLKCLEQRVAALER